MTKTKPRRVKLIAFWPKTPGHEKEIRRRIKARGTGVGEFFHSLLFSNIEDFDLMVADMKKRKKNVDVINRAG